MKTKKKKCHICGGEIGDSNIFIKLPAGKEVGPLCSDCIERNIKD
jgi:hypothetical protein